ncbi:hypothetical protein ACWDAF_38255, partial [Streptomyces sp. NPDC001226]
MRPKKAECDPGCPRGVHRLRGVFGQLPRALVELSAGRGRIDGAIQAGRPTFWVEAVLGKLGRRMAFADITMTAEGST